MRHRRTFAIVQPRQKPVPRNCSACKGTGARHIDGKRVVPWKHCTACSGSGSAPADRRPA